MDKTQLQLFFTRNNKLFLPFFLLSCTLHQIHTKLCLNSGAEDTCVWNFICSSFTSFFLCVLLFHFYSVFIYYKSKIKMVRNLLFAQKYKHATKETCIIFFLCEFLKSTRIENGVLEIFIRCRGDTRSYCSSLVKNVAKC